MQLSGRRVAGEDAGLALDCVDGAHGVFSRPPEGTGAQVSAKSRASGKRDRHIPGIERSVKHRGREDSACALAQEAEREAEGHQHRKPGRAAFGRDDRPVDSREEERGHEGGRGAAEPRAAQRRLQEPAPAGFFGERHEDRDMRERERGEEQVAPSPEGCAASRARSRVRAGTRAASSRCR